MRRLLAAEARRGRLLLAAVLSYLVLAAPPGCSPDEIPRGPNIVLISADTLRADHLGCYGYDRSTSPNIDRLASAATLYRKCFSTSPWTVPSHASMFTGKLPFEHGAHSIDPPHPMGDVYPLGLDNLTLAEALQEEGYRTGAFVSNWAYMFPQLQLNQGFDTYHLDGVYADQLNLPIFQWLDQRDKRPFFLFINYIDTHRPYNVRPRPGLLDAPPVQDRGELLDQLIAEVLPATGPVPEDLARKVIDQYDTSISNLDEQLGKLLDKLEETGVLDNTIIVFTSDHGEYFGEHHLVEHSKDIYQEAIWVPLIVRKPGQTAGEVVDELASSTDIPALIDSLFEGERAVRFRRYFPDEPGRHPVVAQNYYTRPKDLYNKQYGHRFWRVRSAVFEWPFKLIRSSDGNHELFDLEQDPREANNLYLTNQEMAKKLERRLGQVERTRKHYKFTGAPNQQYSEEQLRRM
ncbi:MAG: sulfatase, partial [Planctomycetota bacterium]